MSQSKVLGALVTLADSQSQIAPNPARSKHIALRAKAMLAQTLTIVPGKAH